ncbi:MAG: hypothetical protein L0H31_06550, partial [Nocardioidaceae bacterium]|nr:hypothetical protein [Nocardioidaceae bacterium]
YGGPQAGPYGSAAYLGGAMGPPPSAGTGKTIAIIVGSIILVILLVCGGIVGSIVWMVKTIDDQIDDYDPARSGSARNPITVDVGEEFEIDGIDYQQGWTVRSDAGAETNILGLKATSDRRDDESEYVAVRFKFLDATGVPVARITCSADELLASGDSVDLTCRGAGRSVTDYDRVEVYER